jgi:hypothetical protein
VNGQRRGSDDKFSGTEQRYGNRRASGLEVTVGSDQPQSVLLDGRTEHQIEHRRELFDQSGGRKGGRAEEGEAWRRGGPESLHPATFNGNSPIGEFFSARSTHPGASVTVGVRRLFALTGRLEST